VSTMSWLDAGSASGASAWLAIWRSFGVRRPHDHPTFARLFAPAGGRPVAVLYESDGDRVFYTFTMQAIGALAFCPPELSGMTDIVGPYGYGGPVFEGHERTRPETEAGFRRAFGEECARHGVVSEFVREDLFAERLVPEGGERHHALDNVVVRLGLGEDESLRRYRHKVRKNVRRARAEGLRAVIDERGERVAEFFAVYSSTMERRNAPEFFRLERSRMDALIGALVPERAAALAHVIDGGAVISSELLLLEEGIAYSFLGGTIASAMSKRPNDLLKHEIGLWATSKGYKHYVLGGGLRPDDGIFHYKESFDPGGRAPFLVRRIVRDARAYGILVAARKAAPGDAPREDFFPAYRA